MFKGGPWLVRCALRSGRPDLCKRRPRQPRLDSGKGRGSSSRDPTSSSTVQHCVETSCMRAPRACGLSWDLPSIRKCWNRIIRAHLGRRAPWPVLRWPLGLSVSLVKAFLPVAICPGFTH